MFHWSPASKALTGLGLVFSLVVSALPAFAAPDTSSVDPNVIVQKLPSGQTVYVHPNPTPNPDGIVTVDTWIPTGSVNETAQNNGVSHFLEHLLFKGTATHKAGEFERVLESLGATFNAATSDDFTHYHITLPRPGLEQAMALHADMLLNAALPEDEVNRERAVVIEEINRADDNPHRRLLMKLTDLLYGSHPYAQDTLGPRKNIAELPVPVIRNYYQQWYRPELMKTVVAGDITADEAVDLVELAFNQAKAQAAAAVAAPKKLPVPTYATTPRVQVLTDPKLKNATLAIAFPGAPAAEQQDNLALDAGMAVIGGGESARLWRRLRDDQHLVESVSSGNMTQAHAGMAYVIAELPVGNINQAFQETLATLKRMKTELPEADEIDKIRRQTRSAYVFSQESSAETAQSIGLNVTIGTLEDYTRYLERLNAVSPTMVQAAINQYIDFDKMVVVAALPPAKAKATRTLEKQLGATIQQVRNSASTGDTVANTTTQVSAHVARRQLNDGTTVLVNPSADAKTVSLEVFLPGGQRLETVPGSAALTATLLGKGTRYRTAAQLSQLLESHGMSVSAAATDDALQISASGLSEDRDLMLSLVEEMIQHPIFERADFTQVFANEHSHFGRELANSLTSPSAKAFDVMGKTLYGPHPYGNTASVMLEHLPELTPEVIKQYWQRSLAAGGRVASLAGAVEEASLAPTLARVLNMPDTAAQAMTTPALPVLDANKTVRLPQPEQAATWIVRAWPVANIASEDYLPLKLLNTMLGQGMSSRLFVNLREKQGLAYAVGSTYPSRKQGSHLAFYIGTDPKNEKAVLEGFDRELSELKAADWSTPELQQALTEAKNKLIGAFALAHETTRERAFYPGFYEVMGRGAAFDTEFPEAVRAVTGADVQRVIQTYLGKPSLTVIVPPAASNKGRKR